MTGLRCSAPACFTVLGAGGYIGRALVAALERAGHSVHAVSRGDLPGLLQAGRPAGHVIDCIGLTGDFRTRPLETAEAHVGVTARCLARLDCESFLFLSSTRVYARAADTREDTPLPCVPAELSDLYNLTKLAGEALCLGDPRPTCRVARLSNVYGPGMGDDTFLGQLLNEGFARRRVRFRQAPDSAKDYVSLAAVLRMLPLVATAGRSRLYNLAAGCNTTHARIAVTLRDQLGWQVEFAPDAAAVCFPRIETARLVAEFGSALSDLSADLRTIAGSAAGMPCSPSMRPPTG